MRKPNNDTYTHTTNGHQNSVPISAKIELRNLVYTIKKKYYLCLYG